MVYKNILNTASFASADGVYTGTDNATVELESQDYTFEKTANPAIWSGEGELTYTITLTSLTGEDILDIMVTDVLPEDVTFINTSVTIDGVATTTNFDATNPPNIIFGTETPLTVTNVKPLEIIFQVNKTP